MADLKLALTIDEAARAAGVGRTLIYQEISSRRLIARKIHRRTVILTDDLNQWLGSRPLASAIAIVAPAKKGG